VQNKLRTIRKKCYEIDY